MSSERKIAFFRARFAPEGLFGLHLTIGNVTLIGSAWLFGGVAEDLLTGDPLTIVDVFISEWFRIHATPLFTTRVALVVALVFMIICAVGFSRIYLGAHFFSDVVAAFAAGVAWLAICLTAVETLRRHRHFSSRRMLTHAIDTVVSESYGKPASGTKT